MGSLSTGRLARRRWSAAGPLSTAVSFSAGPMVRIQFPPAASQQRTVLALGFDGAARCLRRRRPGRLKLSLAARLCAEAKDGQILISSRVARAVEAMAILEYLGKPAAEGSSPSGRGADLRRPVSQRRNPVAMPDSITIARSTGWPHPCDAADQRGECTRLAIGISDREWVTDLLRGAVCRPLAGGVWFSELKFPRKWNPHRPIGVGSCPRQLFLNLPRMGPTRRRPVWSAAAASPADRSRGARY